MKALHQVSQNVERCVHATIRPSYRLVRDRSPSKAPLAICTTGLELSCLLSKKQSVAVGERSRQIVYKVCRLLIPKKTPSMIVVIAFTLSFLSIYTIADEQSGWSRNTHSDSSCPSPEKAPRAINEILLLARVLHTRHCFAKVVNKCEIHYKVVKLSSPVNIPVIRAEIVLPDKSLSKPLGFFAKTLEFSGLTVSLNCRVRKMSHSSRTRSCCCTCLCGGWQKLKSQPTTAKSSMVVQFFETLEAGERSTVD